MNEENKALVAAPVMDPALIEITKEEKRFALVQRQAKMWADSDLVPATFKNKIGNCVIAMEMANRLNMNPMMVMQSIQVIHGRPSFEGKFLKALVDRSGRYTPLEYEWEHFDDGRIKSCTAKAKAKSDGKYRTATVTWAMVQAEGWDRDRGPMKSKWRTMPELMFVYRSSAHFAKMYMPEALFGMQTTEEVQDVVDVSPAMVEEARPGAERFGTEIYNDPSIPTPSEDAERPTTGLSGGQKSDKPNEKAEIPDESEKTAEPAGNWWEEEKHWLYRKHPRFHLLVMIGRGLEFRPHAYPAALDRENPVVVIVPEMEEIYNELKADNPKAWGALNVAHPEIRNKVAAKYVSAFKVITEVAHHFVSGLFQNGIVSQDEQETEEPPAEEPEETTALIPPPPESLLDGQALEFARKIYDQFKPETIKQVWDERGFNEWPIMQGALFVMLERCAEIEEEEE